MDTNERRKWEWMTGYSENVSDRPFYDCSCETPVKKSIASGGGPRFELR